MSSTPLLDYFKKGEVEREVRLQAAQGALAPRASEQLAILVLLLEDKDAEIRETAPETSAAPRPGSGSAFHQRSRGFRDPVQRFISGLKDAEIRETADETLNRIPVEALQTFLARSDAPVDL